MALYAKFGSILKYSGFNNTPPMLNPVRCMSALKKLIGGKMSGKTAGRNSQGRITSFHRGGGAKRLHRIIDLKRGVSAMGVVERVEYDPYHSSRLALVRWVEGMKQPRLRKTKPQKSAQSSMDVNPLTLPSSARKVVGSSEVMDPYVVVGLPNKRVPWSKNNFTNEGTGNIKARVRDILFSTLTPRKTKGETPSISFTNSLSFPSVAGAKPAFFARLRDSA
uniref:Large ribosomal subunit protein uL2 RNA-binding domain-containing protein n=1 Tax=Kalanchoe fedtschenkoi TaxID=63787 RepID=A0A7N0V7V6_KALFE